MNCCLLLYYDKFHTPLQLLEGKLARFDKVRVLDICIDQETSEDPLSFAQANSWEVKQIDARDKFCENYLLPAIKANAVYQGGYLLSAALSRPLLAEICAEQITEIGASTLVHGLAGNDQIRLEMAIQALAPQVQILPVAVLLGSQNKKNQEEYTISQNIWGRSIEAGSLNNPAELPVREVFHRTGDPYFPQSSTEIHRLQFEQGCPVALDGRKMKLSELLAALNTLGHKYSLGFVDMVEDGFVGLKTRAIYEAPGGTALIAAHRDLENFVSTRKQNNFKPIVDRAWTELIYDGYWFDPQRESLEAYINDINQWVNGEVSLLFRSGGVQVLSRNSADNLYDEQQAIYRAGQDFGVESSRAIAYSISAHMRAAVKRSKNQTR
ncbi:MAG: argininosuccinate synthase [Prochloron sp. SP5CPC1]|nr:argininosuccinate synthase [Candidatus Paraprochloron terpiosi SP5CPC1]